MPSIAIIGASRDRSKYGNKAVRAYLMQRYTVYPVNPHEEVVEGLKCYDSVLDIEGEIDTASLYVPPHIGVTLLEEIAQKGVKDLYVNSGAESDALLFKAEELGLNAIQACSILAIGINPEEMK